MTVTDVLRRHSCVYVSSILFWINMTLDKKLSTTDRTKVVGGSSIYYTYICAQFVMISLSVLYPCVRRVELSVILPMFLCSDRLTLGIE